MKKICVDKEKCIGCGACEGMEPDVFELGDDGFAESIKKDYEELSDKIKENVDDAISNCPTAAISIKDEKTED